MIVMRRVLWFILSAMILLRGDANSLPVLFFVPVGVSRIELMRDNVIALKKSYPMMYFFFAHYDGPEGRRAYASHQWYQQYVGNHSCAYSGLKAEFIFNELIAQEQLARDPFLQRFPFVWFAVSV